ncbi:MAG: hypothetical protein IJ419_13725 [Agathobacter sp.]|nr:hypothetical protein [Agathobacter sp.]
MKVVPKKYNIHDVKFAKSLVTHLMDILQTDFDFIVNTAPEVTFHMYAEGMMLHQIRFESDDVDAAIVIDEENILLMLDNTQICVLYEMEEFEDILDIDESTLYEMDTVTKERLEDIRKLYQSLQ